MKNSRADTWGAIRRTAERDPQALAILAGELEEIEREADHHRGFAARLRSDNERIARTIKDEADRSRREGARAALQALGDGWHTLRIGGDVLIKTGRVVTARCPNPLHREDMSRAISDAFGAFLGPWSDDGVANESDDIPF